MLMRALRRMFIKNYNNLEEESVRIKHGKVISVYGIAANVFLSIIKLVFGILAGGSISLISDSINNISDTANSVVSLVGFKMSEKPADKEHPFGHARMEHIAGLVISTIILSIGLFLLYTSTQTVISFFDGTAEAINFNWWTVAVLVLSILIKIFLTLDNYYTGKLINSMTLKATARDALSDILVTSGLLISTLVSVIANTYYGQNINIDGFMGAFVSVFIIVSGVRSIIDTASPLIGDSNSKEESKKITDCAREHKEILGVHDVVIHDYGGKNKFISLHVELCSTTSLTHSHAIIDQIEDELKDLYEGANIVIHIDPVSINNPKLEKYRDLLNKYITGNNYSDWNVHDIRLVNHKKKEKIIFELSVPYCESKKKKERNDYCPTIINNFTAFIKKNTHDGVIVEIQIEHPLAQ